MSGCRERVVPDDGRNENRWVALFTAAVLLCGVVGIYLRQAPDTLVAQTPDLTPAGRQQLTELVIALDEAGFMASDGHWPALAAMEQALIPPFSEGAGKSWPMAAGWGHEWANPMRAGLSRCPLMPFFSTAKGHPASLTALHPSTGF